MENHTSDDELTPVHHEILHLLTTLPTPTRVDLAQHLGLAPSTVSLRVQELIERGLVEESGSASSRGGRRARILSVRPTAGVLQLADLGTSHARLGLADANGTLLHSTEVPLDVALGPEVTLTSVLTLLEELRTDLAHTSPLAGTVIGLPAPIDPARGSVDSASRLPGWNGFPLVEHVERTTSAPALLENDANLLALGTHVARPGDATSITVKAGNAIGAGIVIDGNLLRGATGAAGDLAHARVPDGSDLPCACGNTGCLETVASGMALTRAWKRRTGATGTLSDMLTEVHNGDPIATNLVREAGHLLGSTLCTVVGVLNPDAVHIGGLLSTSEAFVAAVRAALYGGCHPLITRSLEITTTSGADAGLLGAARLMRTHVFG